MSLFSLIIAFISLVNLFHVFVPGVRISYDVSKPVGSRVVNCRLRCSQCRVPKYEPLNKTAVYKVC